MSSKIIRIVLGASGVLPCYAGYHYFVEAVSMASSEPDRLLNVRAGLYVPIAETHRVTVERIEKDIRTVRDTFMRNNGADVLYRLTGSDCWMHRNPYPRELISVFADLVIRYEHGDLVLWASAQRAFL